MLSICIPIYNFHVEKLVNLLIDQIKHVDRPVEIQLLDDGSRDELKKLNRSLASLDNVIYEELPENVGRSAVRNKLAQKANYDFLLYLDCDSNIEGEDFIGNYLKYCEGDVVIYGGRQYGPKPKDRNYFLQWFYSVEKNGAEFEVRRQREYHSFCTNNFIIAKKIVLELPFNNDILSGWGHEDTLFAYSLKDVGYAIQHINNPVLHNGYVTNDEFINQMNEGLVNLYRIYDSKQFPTLVNDFKTTRVLKMLERFGLIGIVAFKYSISEKLILKNIRGHKPSLLLFDLHKLGYLCRIHKMKKREGRI